MRFNKEKSRRSKLEKVIEYELEQYEPNILNILNSIDEYEKDNLQTIEKLKRVKTLELKRINGAIRQFLHAHPILTKELTGSLTKRIYGSLLTNEKYKNEKINGFFKRIFIKILKFTK